MTVNGDYTKGPSVMDRLMARALEAQKVADAMVGWVNSLKVGGLSYRHKTISAGTGVGLTEAPRGALGHWTRVAGRKISTYQVLTPTGWNASPRDDAGQQGPIEKALMGVQVADAANPVEVLRVVHSFDPCLSCAVHMVRPERKARL
jgi:hydrogenase large subunit